jgi:hypothetical protein
MSEQFKFFIQNCEKSESIDSEKDHECPLINFPFEQRLNYHFRCKICSKTFSSRYAFTIFLGCFETFYNMFYFNSKIGFIDMFRVLRLQNENKIAEFLTEKFFGSKSNLTNRALVSLN